MNLCCQHSPCMQKQNYCPDHLGHCFIPVATFNWQPSPHMLCKVMFHSVLTWSIISAPPSLSWLTLNTAWHNKHATTELSPLLLLPPLPPPPPFMIGYCSFKLPLKTLSLRHYVTNTDFLYLIIQNNLKKHNIKKWLAQQHGQSNIPSDNSLITAHSAIQPTVHMLLTQYCQLQGQAGFWPRQKPETSGTLNCILWDIGIGTVHGKSVKWDPCAMTQLQVHFLDAQRDECGAKFLPYKTNSYHVHHYNTVPCALWQAKFPQATIYTELTNYHRIV
jgi:hypothetical protein